MNRTRYSAATFRGLCRGLPLLCLSLFLLVVGCDVSPVPVPTTKGPGPESPSPIEPTNPWTANDNVETGSPTDRAGGMGEWSDGDPGYQADSDASASSDAGEERTPSFEDHDTSEDNEDDSDRAEPTSEESGTDEDDSGAFNRGGPILPVSWDALP